MARPTMTPAEFRAALRDIGISQAWLAGKLQLATSTVSHWATGKVPVQPWVPFVLDLLRERREIANRLRPQ